MADETETPTPEETKPVNACYVLRFLKLTNGEDVIANVVSGDAFTSDAHVIAKFPLKVTLMLDPESEDAIFGFSPWIPFTETEHMAISKLSIVTVTSVNQRISDLYAKSVEQYAKKSKEIGEMKDYKDRTLKVPPVEEDPIPMPKGAKVWIN